MVLRTPLRTLAVAAGTVAFMALPASASAAIIGSDLGGTPVNTSCTAGCVVVQDRIAGEYVEVGPERAVITEWRTRAAQGLMALRVYRHRSDVEFTPDELHAVEVGQSDDETGNGGTQSFATRIPVIQGDYIALVVAGGDGTAFGSRQAPPPDTVAFRVGNFDVVDSTSPEALELYLQARVEPDVDADGLGDESQDPCVRCGGPAIAPRPTPPTPDPYAAVRLRGPTVSMAGRARASSRGVVPVKLTNPYAFELKGRLTLKVGKGKVGTKNYSLPAKASKPVKVRLKRSAFRRLKRRRSLRAVGDATVKAPAGPTRRVKKRLRLLAPKKRRAQRRRPTPPARGPDNANATFRGTTEQGFSITIRTSADGRALSTFATTATTASCLRNGSPVSQQTVNILPPLPIPLGADGSFAIDKRNEAEDYDPNYRIQGRLSGSTISGFFAWRRLKTFSNEHCVTRELRFTATRV